MDYKFPLNYVVIVVFIIISNAKANFENVCASDKCVAKCCPGNAYILYANESSVCVPNATFKADFSDVDVYNNNLIRTGSLKDSFNIVDGQLFDTVVDVTLMPISAYVLTDGNLKLKLTLPNAFPKWQTISNEDFCVDYLRNSNDTSTFTLAFSVGKDETENNTFSIAALVISCIFLLLVLIVYLILQDFNHNRKIIMAIVSSLLGAFSLLATHKIRRNRKADRPTEEECYGFTCSIYFFFLATFCWMNVMSYDIWWSLRSIMTRTLRVHRHGKNRKFLLYCLYAWGLPALMAVALRLVDQSELSEKPWIIKPNINVGGCFISGYEKLVYLYIPMMILLLSNWILFLLTALNFWRTKIKDTIPNSDCSHNNYLNQEQRFLVYFRLSVIMGLSFVLEVISSFYPDFSFWYMTDAYNMLIGVVIFIIFVCKKRILTGLLRRFQRKCANDNTESD